MSKKAGILTLSASDNCGSLLQTYALQYLLKEYGCDVTVIDFETEKSHILYDIFPKNIWKHPKRLLLTLKNYDRLKLQKKGYEDFRRENLPMSKCTYTSAEEIAGSKEPFEFDYLFAGSDQIWNVYMADYDRAFFLPWETSAHKIAYAPSLGKSVEPDEEQKAYIRSCLSDFDMLSVREEEGRETLEKITGERIPVVSDPTMLVERKVWSELGGKRLVDGDYIFFYSWAYIDLEMNRIVERFSKEMNMPVYVINASKWFRFRPESFGFKLFEESGPSVFLNLMEHAQYVFVQSFHGAVFANIFNKKFFFLNEAEDGKVDFRSGHLLDMYKEQERVIHSYDELESVKDKELTRYEDDIETLRNRSKEYIKKALEL